MKRVQRVAAYGILHDPRGRVLLVRASSTSTVPGRWFLPGGGLEHGEDPEAGFERELHEETGLLATSFELAGVLADTSILPWGDSLHTIRIVYRVNEWKGELRAEAEGSSDAVAWVARHEVADLPVLEYVGESLARFD